jgi:hypothetical protein
VGRTGPKRGGGGNAAESWCDPYTQYSVVLVGTSRAPHDAVQLQLQLQLHLQLELHPAVGGGYLGRGEPEQDVHILVRFTTLVVGRQTE